MRPIKSRFWKAASRAGLCSSLLVALAGRAEEGPAYLVKDIEPTGEPFVIYDEFGTIWVFYGGRPTQLNEYRGALLFVARDVAHGFELWRSDGTEQGTVLVKDICPGNCSSDIYMLGSFRSWFFFVANDGVTGRELWRTDGTEGGTFRVTDICPGACDLAPMLNPVDPARTPWAVLDDLLYFGASSDGGSPSLWRTDGTATGTWQVRNTCVGECGYPFVGHSIATYQGRLYFGGGLANDIELWTSDGTTTGTYKLVDFCGPFSLGGLPRYFYTFRDELYFVANCGPSSASSVYKTNGTVEGTVHLVGFDGLYSLVGGFVELGNLLFFGIGGQLWRTDGTHQGTYGVADFGQLSSVQAMDDLLVMAAERRFGSGVATLFLSDGTAEGTYEILHAQVDASIGAWPSDPKALFAGGESPPGGPHAAELWLSDGTVDGTGLLSEITPGPTGSAPTSFTRVGSRIFFTASAGAQHRELWALPRTVLTGPRCFDEPTKLCLQDGRFEVSVRFRNQHGGGAEGVGKAVPWSRESGTFTFFDVENTELVVKVLDGRPVTGSFWVFYGGLSDVEFWIEVKDWQTGITRTYHNEPGRICGGAFLDDFPAASGSAQAAHAAAGAAPGPLARPPMATGGTLPGSQSGPCVPGAERLCLLEGRVEVSVHWRNQHAGGTEGEGAVLSGNSKTGFFSFFNPGNVELVVKALDGTGVNGKLWFFYGALSDVEYGITARDTVTGAIKTYHNPPGRLCGVGDTGAL